MASYLPTNFIDHLIRSVPGFNKETKQYEVARMLWMLTEPAHRHNEYKNSIYLSAIERDKLFGGRKKFDEINRTQESEGRYFYIHRFINSPKTKLSKKSNKRYTYGYQPMPWMLRALDEYLLSDNAPTALLKAKNKVVRTIPRAISSLTNKSLTMTAWKDVFVPNQIKVNIENINRLKYFYRDVMQANVLGILPSDIPYLEDLGTQMLSDWSAYRFRSAGSVAIATNNNIAQGYLLHNYEQITTGRLYARGINLQNCPREIRMAALSGCWDYDIDCCHFAILNQMAMSFGFDCSAIRDYIANKKLFRSAIAKESGISYEQAKTVLTMLIYGAVKSHRSQDAIPVEIGNEASSRLYVSPSFLLIEKEVKKAGNIIYKMHPQQNGLFVNLMGMGIKSDNKQASVLAHLLQGVEAAALRSAANFCKDDLLLLMHDGFATVNRLNIKELEGSVFKDTGYRLTFEEGRLEYPYPDISNEKWVNELNLKLAENKENFNLINELNGGLTIPMTTIATTHWDIPPVYPIPIKSEPTPF